MARRIERAYEKAIENKELLKAALNAVPGIDAKMVDAILPFIPELNLDEDKKLYGAGGIFRTRADYERNLRYLDRLNRAIGSEWTGRGTTTFEDILPTQVTSFYVSDGDVYTEFQRREQSLAERNRNRENIQRLKDMGINMVKVPVYKLDEEIGELTTLYDDSRHAVMQYVPETPSMQRDYHYAIQRMSTLEVVNPDTPEGSIVMMHGDVVPASKRKKRKRESVQTMIAQSLNKDKSSMDKTELYFRNMKAVIDTTLPDSISSKFDEVFDQILEEDYETMDDIYRYISGETGDDIADLDFLYLGNFTSTSSKINHIYNVFREGVVPRLSAKVNMEEVSTAEQWEDILASETPSLVNGQNIYSEYQNKKLVGKASSVTMEELKQLRGY